MGAAVLTLPRLDFTLVAGQRFGGVRVWAYFMTKRILLDISTLARATGHADGIVRTLRELARFAAANRPEVRFVYYDLEVDTPRMIDAKWVRSIIDGVAKIDMSYFPDRFAKKQRFRERLPKPLKRLFLWMQRPRRQAYLKLEALQLKGSRLGPWAARVQRLLLNEKCRRELTMPDGRLRRLVPHELAIQSPPKMTKDDTLIFAGADWAATYQQLTLPDSQDNPRVAVLCYDIIPLLFPHFFPEQLTKAFSTCFREVFPRADLVVFTAKQIIADAETYCASEGLELKKSGLVYLGSDFHVQYRIGSERLPDGLVPGRYALFIGTIEPRKGHRLLFEVWKRLLADGIPQQNDFKLVFVGRKGWLVDELVDEIDAHESAGVSLFRLSNVDDATLQQIYAQAAFCLFPSLYEGFGLPVIEAFRYGKAVISSNKGALLETVGGFSPCLDPLDDGAWYEMMKIWIEDPAARSGFEEAIRSNFKPRSWKDVAANFFDLIDRELIASAKLTSSAKI